MGHTAKHPVHGLGLMGSPPDYWGTVQVILESCGQQQGLADKLIFGKWPEAWSYMALHMNSVRGKQLSRVVIAPPMERAEYLNIMRYWKWKGALRDPPAGWERAVHSMDERTHG